MATVRRSRRCTAAWTSLRITDRVAANRRVIILKTFVWAACLTPLGLLVFGAITGDLTANPIEYVTHKTGYWALLLLTLTLAVTPLRRLTHYNELIKYRRLVGLFAFFYALLHFLTYIVADQFFDWNAIAADIVKRPYITVGFTAFVLLLLLASTSTKGWVRRLGRRWQALHRVIYPAAAFAVLHFYWKRSAKSDTADPLLFAVIIAILLAVRIPIWLEKRRSRRRSA